MSKIITIPDCKDPYEVIVNNKKYTYRSGEVVEVPDEVAEIIALHEDVQHPPIRLPEKPSGSNITVDKALSDTSTNPVENQAVTKAFGKKLDKPEQTSNFNRVCCIGNGSTDTIFYNLIYASRFSSEMEAKKITGVPTYLLGRLGCAIPEGDFDTTPKKWVLDQIANSGGTKWYKHNIFVNIQNVTYYNMQIITTSQTAIEYNGNGLIIQGAVIGTMYYGAGGSTSNELQSVGILLPFAETYYPTVIVFESGLPTIKNFITGSFFPSDVTEFIDTPIEL